MTKESERTRQMREHFMELHAEGYTIPEIADMFELSFSTVYKNLQRIADENEVSRESLLILVRTSSAERAERAIKEEREKVRVNVKELKEGFQKLKDDIDFMIQYINNIIEEDKKYESEHYDI